MIPLAFGDPLRLGPYRLMGVLGEGGMGKVYVAHDQAGQLAAVKVLLPELVHDRHLVDRFIREADTARTVASKGVARVHGAQTEGGRLWIATEFLAGPTLEQAVAAHGPLDEAMTRALAAALATTLADIHAAGLIHRDLKPANVILTSAGPRIIDFGIARPEHGLTLTTTGQAPATPGFGAPEQALGLRVTRAADVFSLGATVAYAAGGRPVFRGGHVAAVQYEVVHGEPDLGAVPEALRPLLLPCLAKQPEHRPEPAQIAAAFAPPRGTKRLWATGDIGSTIAQSEDRRREYSTTVVIAAGRKPVSRRRLVTALAAGGTVLAAGGGAAAWWLTRDSGPRLPAAGDVAAAKRVSAPDTEDYEDDPPPKALWGPVKAAADDAPAPLPLRDVLVVSARAGGLTALRIADGTRKWQLGDVAAASGYVAVGTKRFAAVGPSGTVRCHDASTSREVWRRDVAATRLLAADAKAVYLATGGDRIHALDAADGKPLWSVESPTPVGKTARAAADGRLLVLSGDNGTASAFDAASGRSPWNVSYSPANGAATPLLAGGVVYLGGSELAAYQAADGKREWHNFSGPWGDPVLDGDWIVAMNSSDLAARGPQPLRVAAHDGSEGDSQDWYAQPDGDDAPAQRPVFQGGTMWLVEGGDAHGLTVCDRRTGDSAWRLFEDRTGAWRLAAAGNRVFVLNGGSVWAMPVF
ncbi:serine/threonine-protein kinase [Streptomyces sp. NPDC050560]|uniref:serine/threonine-protein kinase n=1 Tax=Streptomyces sp. NPDC050560 TaxID=3365630 RepID=UPI0037A4EC0F